MAKDTTRFTIYLRPDWVRAIKMEAIRRGGTATKLIKDALLKDRKMAEQLIALNGKDK